MNIETPADLGGLEQSGMQLCAHGLEHITHEGKFWEELEKRTDPVFVEVLTNTERTWRRIGPALDMFVTTDVPIKIGDTECKIKAFLSRVPEQPATWQVTLHTIKDAPRVWNTHSGKHQKSFEKFLIRLGCYSRYPEYAFD